MIQLAQKRRNIRLHINKGRKNNLLVPARWRTGGESPVVVGESQTSWSWDIPLLLWWVTFSTLSPRHSSPFTRHLPASSQLELNVLRWELNYFLHVLILSPGLSSLAQVLDCVRCLLPQWTVARLVVRLCSFLLPPEAHLTLPIRLSSHHRLRSRLPVIGGASPLRERRSHWESGGETPGLQSTDLIKVK